MGNKRGRQGAELALVDLHAVRSSEKDLDIIFRAGIFYAVGDDLS